MLITYNFYSSSGSLPDPIWLFEVTRRLDFMMREIPNRNWSILEKWARPMGQLRPGLFMNISDTTEDEIEKAININGKKIEDTKLEQIWIGKGYIRIQFHVQGQSTVLFYYKY